MWLIKILVIILLKLLILHKRSHRTPLGCLRNLSYVSKWSSPFAILPHIVDFKRLVRRMVLCPLILLNLRHWGCNSRRAKLSGPSIINWPTRHNHFGLRRSNNFRVHLSLILSVEMSSVHFCDQGVPIPRWDLLIIRVVFEWQVLVDAKSRLLKEIFFLRSWIPGSALVKFTMVLHLSEDLPFVGLLHILFFPFLSLVQLSEVSNLMLQLGYLDIFLALLFRLRLVFLNFCLSLEIFLPQIFILENDLLALICCFIQFWGKGNDLCLELRIFLLLWHPFLEIANSLFYYLIHICYWLIWYLKTFSLNRFAFQLLNFLLLFWLLF